MKILHERFDFCHWMKSGDDLVTKIKLFKKQILKKISKFDELKHLILENFLNLSILMFMATLRHQFDDLLFAHFEKKYKVWVKSASRCQTENPGRQTVKTRLLPAITIQL